MTDKPDYLEHRKRIRERFLNSSGKGLSDYELIELLLTYAIPRKDVKPIAKKLSKKFGGLRGILDCSREELEKIEGIGSASYTFILLIKEIIIKYFEENMIKRDVLSSPGYVVDFAKVKLSGIKDEVFICIFVNTKNEVMEYEIIQEGTIDQVVLHPRKVLERALYKKASGIILIHNHPSGHVEPSEEDKVLTSEMIKASELINLRILDHLIIGSNSYYSFRENSLI